jgi:hypothetical protein
MYLTIVDTTQIQAYVFASNRLRENIGASHLVAQATGRWAREAVNQAAPSHNIANIGKGTLNPQRMIVSDGSPNAETVTAEVLYTGGGNAVALFQTSDQVSMFKRKLSCRVLKDAPGLQLVIAEKEFQWDDKSLAAVMGEVFDQLRDAKRSRKYSVPLLGLGVTVECQSTALPTVEYFRITEGEEPRPISAETAAKLKANDPAKTRPKEICGSLTEHGYAGYDYPDELDHLGRTSGEQSHIAVTHADGDGMGDKIQDIGKKYSTPADNREYIKALRSFSQSVEEAAQAALKTTLKCLLSAIDKKDHTIQHKDRIEWITPVGLSAERDKKGNIKYHYVPFRPIVFGGDDVTFVCDGRLGIALAKIYAEEFAKETSSRTCGALTACTGVALVKAHYPFARAYQMAEQLLKSAKTYRREVKGEMEKANVDWSDACLDWHFALTGLSGSLADIRDREYEVGAGSLLLRPLALGNNPKDEHRAWPVFGKILSEYQIKWAERRNKMKALRESLREGPDAVKEFLTLYEQKELPESGLVNDEAARETGWVQKRCRDFDAIEMADWYIPIEQPQTEGAQANAN